MVAKRREKELESRKIRTKKKGSVVLDLSQIQLTTQRQRLSSDLQLHAGNPTTKRTYSSSASEPNNMQQIDPINRSGPIPVSAHTCSSCDQRFSAIFDPNPHLDMPPCGKKNPSAPTTQLREVLRLKYCSIALV